MNGCPLLHREGQGIRSALSIRGCAEEDRVFNRCRSGWEMLLRYLVLGSSIAAIHFCDVSETVAEVISVDFSSADASPQNTGYSANRVQNGFVDFSHGPETSYPTMDMARVPPSSDGAQITRTFGSIGVTVSDPFSSSNGLYFYDWGTIDVPYGRLAEDLVYPSGLDLYVTLSGLAAGLYSMTTYHHFPSFSNQYSLEGITIDTGTGATMVAQNVPVSTGYSPTFIGTASFQFLADGSHDIVMTVHGDSLSTVRGVLNGFEVSSVPEPSTVLLLVTAVLGFVFISRLAGLFYGFDHGDGRKGGT